YISYGYDAIYYAATHGADIINCSWGGGGFSMLGQDVINYVTNNENCLVVAAGGNVLSETVHYPAGYKDVLGVGATDHLDKIQTTWGPHIDVLAPGASLTTTQEMSYWTDGVPYSSFSS